MNVRHTGFTDSEVNPIVSLALEKIQTQKKVLSSFSIPKNILIQKIESQKTIE